MSKVRTPKQHRGIQTKNRIMKAAFQLFAKKGIHGTNSKEFVEKAGVSIGSFYSYFKDKKTLLLEMLEDYLDRHYTAIWRPMNNLVINELGRDDGGKRNGDRAHCGRLLLGTKEVYGRHHHDGDQILNTKLQERGGGANRNRHTDQQEI